MNLTDLLAMPLVQVEQGRMLGTVTGFAITDKRVSHYIVADEDYASETAYAFGEVYVGKSALCTLSTATQVPPTRIPFRCAVYTPKGTHLGYLDEVRVAKDGKMLAIVVNDMGIGAARIAAIEDVVIANTRGQKRGTKTAGEPSPVLETVVLQVAAEEAPVANVLPEATQVPAIVQREEIHSAPAIEQGKEGTPPTVEDANKNASYTETYGSTLRRIIGNYSFLLGRILQEDLVEGGKVLLPKGHVLTDRDVAEAWKRGLLVAVTRISRA